MQGIAVKADPLSLRGAKRRGNLHNSAQRDGDCFATLAMTGKSDVTKYPHAFTRLPWSPMRWVLMNGRGRLKWSLGTIVVDLQSRGVVDVGRAAGLLAARVGHRAVFRGDAAHAGAAQERRHAAFDAGGAQHLGVADQAGAFRVGEKPAQGVGRSSGDRVRPS